MPVNRMFYDLTFAALNNESETVLKDWTEKQFRYNMRMYLKKKKIENRLDKYTGFEIYGCNISFFESDQTVTIIPLGMGGRAFSINVPFISPAHCVCKIFEHKHRFRAGGIAENNSQDERFNRYKELAGKVLDWSEVA